MTIYHLGEVKNLLSSLDVFGLHAAVAIHFAPPPPPPQANTLV